MKWFKNNPTVEEKRNFKASSDLATHLSERPLLIVGNLTSIIEKFHYLTIHEVWQRFSNFLVRVQPLQDTLIP